MTVSDKINLAIAVCAGLSAFVAAIYTFVTARILRANKDAVAAMREQVHELSRPRIQVWPSPRMGTQLICLTIRNSGPSAAEHVTLSIDRDFFAFGEAGDDKNLRNFSAFREPFDALGPGAEMIFYLGTGPQLLGPSRNERTPLQFRVDAAYGFSDRTYQEATTVDLKPFLHSAVPQDPVAEEVEKVWREVKRLGDEARNLRQWFASSNKSLERGLDG
jgi:hypothetical protein